MIVDYPSGKMIKQQPKEFEGEYLDDFLIMKKICHPDEFMHKHGDPKYVFKLCLNSKNPNVHQI